MIIIFAIVIYVTFLRFHSSYREPRTSLDPQKMVRGIFIFLRQLRYIWTILVQMDYLDNLGTIDSSDRSLPHSCKN
jgi:hypothetical protein